MWSPVFSINLARGLMYKQFRIIFLILLTSNFFMACAEDSKLKPLAETESYPVPNSVEVDLAISHVMEPITIERTKIRKILDNTIGRIPVAGELIQLPLNLVNLLLPDFSDDFAAEFPSQGEWTDEQIKNSLREVKLKQLVLFMSAEKDCSFLGCRPLDFDFISKMKVYLVAPESGLPPLLFASGTKTLVEDKGARFILQPEDLNLKDWLFYEKEIRFEIEAEGKPPKQEVTIEGKADFDVKLDVNL